MVIGGGARALHAVVDCAAGPNMNCWAQREKCCAACEAFAHERVEAHALDVLE